MTGRVGPLRTSITSEGQRYFDEPVLVEVSKAVPLALTVNAAFSRVLPSPRIFPVIHAISHYNRVPLRWMKPDGRGGLVARKGQR